MPIVKLNDLFKGLSGTLGDLTLSSQNGRVIVRPKPRVPTPRSPAQLAHQQAVKDASAYGVLAKADPVLSLAYAAVARAKGLTIYQVAFGDFLKWPSVLEIDPSALVAGAGGPVLVRAADNVEVTELHVSVESNDGSVIEAGAAVLNPQTGWWVYQVTAAMAPQQTVAITATAYDRPRHCDTKTVYWKVV